MQVTVYGARGSFPVSGTPFLHYGGNTTCVDIELSDGHHIIFDGGSGLYVLGKQLEKEFQGSDHVKVDIIISHTHWDHVVGLPFFRPLYMENVEVTIHSPVYQFDSVENLYKQFHDPLHHPVGVEALKAKLNFREIHIGETFKIGLARLSTMQLNHPAKAVGYRIECDGRVFTTVTDNAPIENNVLGLGMKSQFFGVSSDLYDRYNEQIVELARDSNLVLYDAHFTEEDFKGREHWGHSTAKNGLDLVKKANAKGLLLWHHNPNYNDTQIKAKEDALKASADADNITLITAREGLRIAL